MLEQKNRPQKEFCGLSLFRFCSENELAEDAGDAVQDCGSTIHKVSRGVGNAGACACSLTGSLTKSCIVDVVVECSCCGIQILQKVCGAVGNIAGSTGEALCSLLCFRRTYGAVHGISNTAKGMNKSIVGGALTVSVIPEEIPCASPPLVRSLMDAVSWLSMGLI